MRHDVRDPKGEDRSEDVSCPARPLRRSSGSWHPRGLTYTLTRVALPLVGCGGLLEWKQTAGPSYCNKHQASSKLRHCSCMIYNYPCDEPDSSDSTLYCICVRSHVRVNCISSPARCAATRSATGSAIAAAAATGASGASGLGRRARASPSSSAPPSSGRRVGPRGSAASGWRRLVVKSGTSSILGAAGGGLLGPPQASQLLRRRASSWRSAA